jgi:hypothetical protein
MYRFVCMHVWVFNVQNYGRLFNSHIFSDKISTAQIYIWIRSNALYIKYYAYLIIYLVYTAKNAQVDAILMKTGLNNVLLPTLFIAVNNIEQYCYTRFRLNNIVQHCWQVWTTWAAKHCSVLLSNGLGVFCRVDYFIFTVIVILLTVFILTHPVNFPCGRKPEHPEKTHDFQESVEKNLFIWVHGENWTHELRVEKRLFRLLRHQIKPLVVVVVQVPQFLK